ncbi:Retrovirus-related Pol polyprotein from transposon 17.6, partial [Mucuna pruriens]
MEEEAKPIRQQQRRLNLTILDVVVKKEVIKLHVARIIYLVLDSQWVSSVQVVPKKSGIIVTKNQHDDLVPMRIQNNWQVYIDYRRLNQATRKDHFPLPFIDQVLEKLVGKSHYCFLDGFFGYLQIHIEPKDQHKTTFTSPFGTFAYTRMPFGLCNAPSTFHCCMTSIFSNLLQNCIEVFMDDFIVYADSFDACLENLSKVLTRCIDTNLVLNFEKCHFMVTEGILLRHLVSNKAIKVDKSKIDNITSLPNPASVRKKPDAKPRLIRWMLLLQEFNIEVKHKKGAENSIANNLSRIEKENDPIPIQDELPDEKLLHINTPTPWFTDICNFVAASQFPPEASQLYKEILRSDAKYYIWDDPYLWRLYNDQVIHRGGHYGSTRIAKKVLDYGFYWTTIFKDVYQFVSTCKKCQKAGMAISRRHEMPQQPILFYEVFDVWGIDFIGPFLVSNDYVSRWVEAITTKTNNAKVVVEFLKSNIFYKFGVPKALICDQGKLHSRWDGPFVITNVFPYGVVKLKDEHTNNTFQVNGHQIKPILDDLGPSRRALI